MTVIVVGADSPQSDGLAEPMREIPESVRSFVADAQRVDADLLGAWRRLYPWDHWEPGAVPVGIATVLLRRAFVQMCGPRPSEASRGLRSLRLKLHSGVVVSEQVIVAFDFEAAPTVESRSSARCLDFALKARTDSGRLVFDGHMTTGSNA